MLTQYAVAQDEQADESDTLLEEVIVTGSRIKRADVDSASPVTVIDRASMEVQGLTDVGELLQTIPSMSGSPVGTTTNNGNDGSVLIDLRGMGTARTLTLVNGRRVVDGGDYQAIPSTMIERIEILKDGASAIYGADAVAGVVNIITRSDFTGVEVSVQAADWFDSEGAQQSYSFLSGKEFAEGHFVFGAEYVKQDAAFQSDVPWDYMQNSYYIYPEGCENQVAAPYDGTPQGGCYPLGSSRIPESRLSTYSQGRFLIGVPATEPYQVGLMEPHDGRTYNYAPVNYLQTPYERTNVFGEGHFDITDNIRFYGEFRGNFRESAQQLAPLPFSGTDPMYDGFYFDPETNETVAFHGISPDNYYLQKAFDAYNAANGTSLRYEPVDPARRMIETNRRFEQKITQYQWTAGLEGSFRDMDWDVYINEGYRDNESRDFGQFSGSRLFNAMGPSADLNGDGQPECYATAGDPNTLITGCVPMNLFGGGAVDAAGQPTVTTLTQDMIDYVALDTVDSIFQRQRTAGASLSGSSFELPGGELGWAVGWAYWKQELTVTKDSAKTIGAVTGNVGANTSGTLTNNAVYAEFLAPLYDNGTQNLYLKGGLRYDDWSAFDGDWTYQLGLEFQALDSVKLRATYGTVFRAPTISDLYGGQVDSFPQYSDPCAITGSETLPAGCAQVAQQFDTQVLARVGGNPNLQPETGDTFTAGIVWTPSFGDHSITMTVDYWKINLDDGIASLGVQYTLDECYINQNSAACALITRNNNADYTVANIIDAQLNVATQGASGVDTEIRWDYETSWGLLGSDLMWTHNLDRTISQFPGSPEEEFVGRYSLNQGAAFAEDKLNWSFSWSRNDLTLSWRMEYISALDADTFCNCGDGNQPDGSYIQKIDSLFFNDLVASYTFDTWGSTTTLAAGITNIFDEAPPYIETGFNATTDPSTYRMFGRGWYLRLKWAY
jgi:outer membrane receptor protein involved in Fe transport